MHSENITTPIEEATVIARSAIHRICRLEDGSKASIEAAAESIMAALKMTDTSRGRRSEYAVKQNVKAEMTDKTQRRRIDDETQLRMSHKCAHFAPPLQNERKTRQQTQEKIHETKPKTRRDDAGCRKRLRSACEWRNEIKKYTIMCSSSMKVVVNMPTQ